jgi:hypothetical protein
MPTLRTNLFSSSTTRVTFLALVAVFAAGLIGHAEAAG